MAIYPTDLHLSPGSKITFIDDVKVERATNGVARGRVIFAAPKRKFEMFHAYLTVAQRDNLRAFYDANRAQSFTLNWFEDSDIPQVSTVLFTGPIKWEVKSGIVWFATLVCEEV